MSEADYLQGLRRAADRNHVRLRKESKLAGLFSDEARAGAVVRNVYKDADGSGYLVLSTRAATAIHSYIRGPRIDWSVPHTDLVSASVSRHVGPGNALFTDVVLRTSSDDHAFVVGLTMPDELHRLEVVQQNAEIIVEEINEVASQARTTPSTQASPPPAAGFVPPEFSIQAPEMNAEKGRTAYAAGNFAEALEHYEMAVNMLDTLYRFENMRTRQPSPADAWIVDGYVSALERAIPVNPNAAHDAASVIGQLSAISAECRRVGAPSVLYDGAADRIRILSEPA